MRQYSRCRRLPNPLLLIGSAAVCMMLLLFTCFEFRQVEGTSMEPTLRQYSTVVVFRLAYGLRFRLSRDGYLFEWKQASRNDIIVFDHPVTGDAVVKRCVGVAGDLVRPNGRGYEILDGDARNSDDAVPIPVGNIFVAGDRPGASIDSRHYGYVALSSVHGRVIYPRTDGGKRTTDQIGRDSYARIEVPEGECSNEEISDDSERSLS